MFRYFLYLHSATLICKYLEGANVVSSRWEYQVRETRHEIMVNIILAIFGSFRGPHICLNYL